MMHYKEGELTIFEDALKELVLSKKLVEEQGRDMLEQTGLPTANLTYKDYCEILAPESDELPEVSRAAAKRAESIKQTLAKKNKWVEHDVQLDQLIKKIYVRQKRSNDDIEEEMHRKATKAAVPKHHVTTWEGNLAEETSAKLDHAVREFDLTNAVQFAVKANKPGWMNNQLFLSSKREPRIKKEGPMEGEKAEELSRHRKRLALIKRGEVPPSSMFKQKAQIEVISPVQRTARGRPQTALAKKTMHRVLPKFDPKKIVPYKPGEVQPTDQQLLENSRAIKKSIVNDIRMLQMKGEAFRRNASHFAKRQLNPMHMMNLFYDNRERAGGLANSNVMIDGERFEYSEKFKAATEDAVKKKKELKAIYKNCF